MAEDKKLKVWVIYQGKEKGDSLGWVYKLFAELEHKDNVVARYTKYNDPGFKNSILEAVYESIIECDFAIALVTLDERNASEAGNLWFEMGLWLGRKGKETIRLLVHNDAKSNESKQLISDFGGYPYVSYSDENELREKIKGFIQKYRDIYRGAGGSGEYGSREKIRDALGRGRSTIWLEDDPYQCKHNKGEICNLRLNSYAFSSELLRMSKTNREVSVIKVKYLQYARLIKVIESKASNRSNRKADSNLADRQHYMRELGKNLKNIDYLASVLFRRTKTPYKENWPPKQRWFNFIKSRLDAAKELRDNMIHLLGKDLTADEREQLDVWKHVLEEGVCIESLYEQNKKIVKMIDGYIKPDEGYQTWRFYECGSFDEKCKVIGNYSESNVFATMTDYFSKVADVLDILLSYYYNTCRLVIDKKLDAIPDPKSVYRTLKEIEDQLPHNGSSGHTELSKYHIWPTKVVGV